jgi:opacity protein-like surface antigen
MKRILLASAALTMLGAGSALAQDGSWYVGAGVGANWVSDESVDTIFNNDLEFEFDTGWAVLGDVGYRWYDSNFRLAVELGYRSNDVETVDRAFGGTMSPVSGDVTQFSAMVNMLFDFPLSEGAVLTLGGGIGAASADFEATGSGSDIIDDGDDGFQLAYQGIAGLAFEVSDNVELFAEYRYMANHAHDVTSWPPPNVPLDTEADFDNHTGTIGLRFFFGEEAVAEPTPEPTPVAPQTNYTIYFNKKGALTADAQATIQEAADTSKGGAPVVTIEAQGGGPRAGDAVTRALVDLGIAEEKISVQTHDSGDATITITN